MPFTVKDSPGSAWMPPDEIGREREAAAKSAIKKVSGGRTLGVSEPRMERWQAMASDGQRWQAVGDKETEQDNKLNDTMTGQSEGSIVRHVCVGRRASTGMFGTSTCRLGVIKIPI